MEDKKLFSSYDLGPIALKNRVVMAPMTRSRAVDENAVTDITVTYYKQRAGAGLIITEGTSPSPNGLGYPRIPGNFSDKQVAAWKKVTDAVHEEGAKIFLQLMHVGRVAHIDNLPEGAEVVSPTNTTVSGEMYVDGKGPQPHTQPRAMNKSDIDQAIAEYVNASRNAIQAGFDGVELHGANGYLIEQFLNANVNDRTDEYGGSAENRNRFAIEVAKAVVEAIGAEKTGIRLSPYGVFNDTGAYDGVDQQYFDLAKALGELNLAYIHLVDHSAMGAPEVPRSVKEGIRDAFGSTIIISGGYDHESAEKDLQSGLGHLVAFGRPFISNPDLVYRFKEGITLADPNPDTFYTPGPEGYIDYPKA